MAHEIRVIKDERGEFFAAVVRPHKGYPDDVQEVRGVGWYGTEAEAREQLTLSLAEELVQLRKDVSSTCDKLLKDLVTLQSG